jgi:hypothetical protein
MKTIARWSVAVIVVLAAFVIPTWLCGAFILTGALKDPAVRWTVAASAGLAVSALATLWGHSFAKRETAAETGAAEPAAAKAAKATSGKVRNTIKAKGGISFSSVTQARDITVTNSGKSASEQPEESEEMDK